MSNNKGAVSEGKDRIYHGIGKRFLKKLFPFWQRLGLHITLKHFYEPVPDTTTLKDEIWRKDSEMVGINIREQDQINLLSDFRRNFKEEYESLLRTATPVPYQYYINNGGFKSVDAEVLYCMIRHFKPKRIIEIGSGNSTYLSAQGLLKNKKGGTNAELVAIEPYPNDTLKKGFPGLSRLITGRVQNISLSEFSKLEENDILFIDSSHVLKIGSDVQYEYLEVLPRLKKGVIVHVHDIFFPSEYPREWVLEDYRFWNEQYLLRAFLSFNSAFEVLWMGHYMHLKHPELLKRAFNSYKSETASPASFWMRRKSR